MEKIKNLFRYAYFLLCNKNKRQKLIDKNAILFIGLQKLAKRYSEIGDLRTAFEISDESYKYLNNFALYNSIIKADTKEAFKNYV